MELCLDARVYDKGQVTIIEIMGRNAGWLTRALKNLDKWGRPQLIYIPEVPFSEEQFLADVKEKMQSSDYVLVCVSEGIRDETGQLICERQGEKMKDAFGHKHLSGVGKYLGNLVREKIGCKTRDIELSLMQRCSSHIASAADIEESRMLGAAALDRAFDGGSGEMSVIHRLSGLDEEYEFRIETTPIENVANHEKLVPLEWLNEKKNNVTIDMINYLKPLIQGECHVRYKNGVPEHIRLDDELKKRK
jgi:6-phosphofructokinase 1